VTRYVPSSSCAVDADDDALRAEAGGQAIDQFRVGQRRRIHRDLVGAGVAARRSASATERMPPATQNGMSSTRATRAPSRGSTERPRDWR
jgi:hypothetical protein